MTFEKNFYDYEKRISYNNFKSAYLVPALEERLNDCLYEFRETGAINEQHLRPAGPEKRAAASGREP